MGPHLTTMSLMLNISRRLHLSLLSILLFATACQVKPANSIHDLAAIHDKVTWQPVANPEIEELYQVSDHRALEEVILVNMGAVAPSQFSHAFELSSWMLVMLMHDDNPVARRKSVALLGNLAAGWIANHGATLSSAGDADIEQGLLQLREANDGPSLESAAQALLNSPAPDVYTAIRILSAYGRIIHNVPISARRHPIITSLALRLVLTGLYAAMLDADEEVSSSAQTTVNLLESHAK